MSARQIGWFILAFAAILPLQNAHAQRKCDYGYVWREAFPGDYVCVIPEVRNQARVDNATAPSRWAPAADPNQCKAPFVWRNAFPGDKVCVTTASRDEARGERQYAPRYTSVFTQGPRGPHVCKQGYVWREAGPQDYVCVEPPARARVRQENARAAQHRGSNTCIQGLVWREAGTSDYVCVKPDVREQARRDNAAWNTGERDLGAICDRYALEAAAQTKEARVRGCRMPGDPARWQDHPAAHANWCQTAHPQDRNGEAGARRKALQDCGAPTPVPQPPPGEACSVSVIVRNDVCTNFDGSPSSLQPGGSMATGCGGSQENARTRARLSFATNFGCVTDQPTQGCCTVREDVVSGCLCP